jgi:hypothetical protein
MILQIRYSVCFQRTELVQGLHQAGEWVRQICGLRNREDYMKQQLMLRKQQMK